MRILCPPIGGNQSGVPLASRDHKSNNFPLSTPMQGQTSRNKTLDACLCSGAFGGISLRVIHVSPLGVTAEKPDGSKIFLAKKIVDILLSRNKGL
jgi:hypothetical protein